jgi:phospholipase/carboxylesterase
MTHSPLQDVRAPEWAADAGSAAAIPLLLHGFGSNERDLTGLAPALRLGLPWASLRAPLQLGNGGAAWFEIIAPGNPAAEPVVEATDAIWAWVDANVDASVRVIPIGFSQGGLMASQLLRTRPERVLATVVLGGFVLGAPQPGDDDIAATRPPVFWGRGADDRVIGVPAIERTSDFLPRHSTLVERIYPGLAHGISQDEIDDVSAFIAARLAETRR